MIKKTQTLTYGSAESKLDGLVTSKKTIPEWYKKLSQYRGDKLRIDPIGYESTASAKACIPFLESLTLGYQIRLWSDLQVELGPTGAPEFSWLVPLDVMAGRPDDRSHSSLPIPAGHSSTQYVWKIPYTIQTPPGYSLLINHPFNRFELPFTTLSGVVDSDKGLAPGNLPFYIKEGFEGVIPVGTPIAQVLPFKRDSWELNRDDARMSKLGEKLNWDARASLSGFYKNNIWQKKQFN